MRKLLVLDVVGLARSHLGADAPRLSSLASEGFAAPLDTVFPAVTCPVQATFATGTLPREHGIVANGWYFRDLSEVWLWRQSNRLVEGEKVFEALKREDPAFTCAWLFWWFAMAGEFDLSVTPRPAYFADGKKAGDIWTDPPELKADLNAKLGLFPLFDFWGPRAGIRSSQWIADATRRVIETREPTLCFAYLPHLDYDLQRFGPDDARARAALRAIDAVCGDLIDAARAKGYRVLVLSEYAIEAVEKPVAINRVLRERGWLRAADNMVGELLDFGASRAFAVADHQVAHVYVKRAQDVAEVKRQLEATPGVDRVLDAEGKRQWGLDHERSGELVAVAAKGAWFSYPYWLDDAKAPDFARTVDIHKKPGYDPAELFLDPAIAAPKLKVASILLKKLLGFRYVMDVIPLDASIVRGSHGRLPGPGDDGPVVIGSERSIARERVRAMEVAGIIQGLVA